MTYYNYTLNSATPAVSIMNQLDTDLTAFGWVKDENNWLSGSGGSQTTWNVYRSPAGSNSAGTAFYFAMGRLVTSPTYIYFTGPFEGYNTSTKNCSNYCPQNTATSRTPAATTFLNPDAAAQLATSGTTFNIGGINTSSLVTLPVSTNFALQYSINYDRVILALRAASSANFGLYIGLYDSIMNTTDDPFPLCWVSLASGSSGPQTSVAASFGGATREPKTTIASTRNFWVEQPVSGGAIGTSQGWGILPGGGATAADVYSGRWFASRCPLYGQRHGSAQVRGLLKDVYLMYPNTNAVVGADTMNLRIGSTTKTCSASSASSWFEQI